MNIAIEDNAVAIAILTTLLDNYVVRITHEGFPLSCHVITDGPTYIDMDGSVTVDGVYENLLNTPGAFDVAKLAVFPGGTFTVVKEH